jgi:diguanylate cyclase (GGDEF)-like protein/PAS domain S-box-containing protein
MTGVTLEAMGVPAAALCSDRGGKLVVEAANGALLRLLGGGGARVTGASAEALLPRSVVAAWTEGEHAEPVDTRLGSLGLPHRAIARALPPDAHGGRRLLATFLPTATLPMPEAAGLAPSDLGATALEILDMQGEMVSRWRLDGTIVYCNEAFARQCGRELDAVIGANLFELTPAHEIEQIKRNVADLSPTMPTSSYDHHIPVSERGERWQEWIDRAIFDEGGRMIGYLSVGRDITARKLAERRLAESERRLKLALEAGRQGVWELDFQTRQVEIDRALEQLLRLPPGAYDLDVEGAGETYHPDDQERVRVAIEAVIRGETDAYRIEARRRLGDGGWCWVLNFGRVAERDDSGRPLRMVGTTIDINQRKQAELDLSDREQRLRLALEAGSLGVWECELASERIHYDAICLSRLGWGAERCDWALAEAIELVHVRDRAKVRQMFAQFRRGDRGQARVEFRMRRRDGGYAWIEEHAQVSERSADGLPTQLVGVSADITARKEAEMRLAHMALHDPLTGLPNRRALADALDRAIARARRTGLPLAVLALDLDGFKAVNDRHGHPAGDATLLQVAARLQQTIRRSDLVARLGGDEFAVIATDLNGPAPIVRLARRLGAALRVPIHLEDAVAEIDVSIGVAFYPGDGETTEQLLARADAALYAAKRERTGYCFTSDLPVAIA